MASVSRVPGKNSNSRQDLTWSGLRRLMTPSRSRKTAMPSSRGVTLLKQRDAGGLGDGVLQHEVAVFDHPVAVTGDVDRRVHCALKKSATEAHDAYRRGAAGLGRLDRCQDVG